MSDYLSNVIARTLNPAASIQPRLASPFEPPPVTASGTLYGPALDSELLDAPPSPHETGPAEPALQPPPSQPTSEPAPQTPWAHAEPSPAASPLQRPAQEPAERRSERAGNQPPDRQAAQRLHAPAPPAEAITDGFTEQSAHVYARRPAPALTVGDEQRTATNDSPQGPERPRQGPDTPARRAAEEEHEAEAEARPLHAERDLTLLEFLVRQSIDKRLDQLRPAVAQATSEAASAAVQNFSAEAHALASGPSIRSAAAEREPTMERARPLAPQRVEAAPARPAQATAPAPVLVQPQVSPYARADAHLSDEPPAKESPAPTINVSIGRIEVRAAPPAPAPEMPGPAPRATGSLMSLDEYLRQRAQGVNR